MDVRCYVCGESLACGSGDDTPPLYCPKCGRGWDTLLGAALGGIGQPRPKCKVCFQVIDRGEEYCAMHRPATEELAVAS